MFEIVEKFAVCLFAADIESDLVRCDQYCDLSSNTTKNVMGDETDL
jgi:hypothetical protein